MTDDIDLAGQIRPGDRIAWSGAAMEPAGLLAILERQLDDVPADCTALLNLSVTRAIDEARLADKLHITAVGGSVTNTRFQAVGALDVLPTNYSMLPRLVGDGPLAVDVVLLQLAADGANYNLSLMVDHLADAVPKARVVVAEINDQMPVTFGDTTDRRRRRRCPDHRCRGRRWRSRRARPRHWKRKSAPMSAG